MRAAVLDDLDALAQRDPQGMLRHVMAFPTAWRQALDAAAEASLTLPREPRNLAVLGMGGSGIVGDVVTQALAPTAPFPVTVVKDYALPASVGKETLALAVSYSGDTEETLWAAAEAADRGATILAVTSGGRLAKAAERHGWPRVRVPAGIQPRAALPHLAGRVLGTLASHGLGPAPPGGDGLSELGQACGPEIPQDRNPAKRWAAALAPPDVQPVVYGAGPQATAALRLKCQLNENAKVFARWEALPEANHNDLVPWGRLRHGERVRLLMLRTATELPAVAARFAFLEHAAQEAGVGILVHSAAADDAVGAMLESILLGDFVSVYTALARGVDPTPVEIIGQLKAMLMDEGLLRQAAQRLGV